jgi:lipoprotein-releasing system permease protein
MLPYWIAKRYIISRRTLQFISVVTILSWAGITVGVAAIICVSSIFNGFRELYQDMMLASDPHIRVTPAKGSYIQSDSLILQEIKSSSDVVNVRPILSGKVAVQGQGTLAVAFAQGISAQSLVEANDIASSVVTGSLFPLVDKENSSSVYPVVVGSQLSSRLRVLVGDTISLLSPNGIEQSLQSLSSPDFVRCIVAGIMISMDKEVNESRIIMQRATAERIFGISDNHSISTIDIRLTTKDKTTSFKQNLLTKFSGEITVETWTELHKNLYSVMEFERYGSFIVLSLIVMVAVFNIFALLTMTVVKKRRDIGIIHALGGSEQLIRNIFLTEGLIIGLSGTITGSILGLGLCFLQKEFGLIKLSAMQFIIPAIPVSIAWFDVIAIILLTLVCSFIATIYPARRAAEMNITSALSIE